MTDALPWMVLGTYSLYSVFLFYQQLHLKNFQGANQTAKLAFATSYLGGMITGIVFLALYWTKFGWVAALTLFGVSFAFKILVVLFEVMLTARPSRNYFWLSAAGFVGWPVCAFLMFSSMPTVTE